MESGWRSSVTALGSRHSFIAGRQMIANAALWKKESLRVPAVAPSWPHEILVKLFSSKTHSDISARFLDIPRAEVLDVGCYAAKNARFFESRGHRCTIVEVTDDMVREARKNVARLGLTSEVFLGTNRKLPFPDASFDLVTSLGAIHYDHGDGVVEAMREFKRVTKPGGIVFIQTAGDKHMIREGAQRLDALKWKPHFGDFRDNAADPYGLFDTVEHLREVAETVFSEVEAGYSLEQYPKRTVDFFFAVCAA